MYTHLNEIEADYRRGRIAEQYRNAQRRHRRPLFQQGCERSAMDGCVRLGVLYRQGAGVTRDVPKATALFKQVMRRRQPVGLFSSRRVCTPPATVSHRTSFVRPTCSNARAMPRCPSAVWGLAVSRRLERACRETTPPRQPVQTRLRWRRVRRLLLSRHRLRVRPGLTQNFQRAAELHRQACASGYGEACYRLAGLYEKGAGVRRDAERAATMMKRACDNGYTAACAKPKAT